MRFFFPVFFLLLAFFSCQKKVINQLPKNSSLVEIPNAAITTPGACDYNAIESNLTATGWTKIFDENFDAGLSNWNIWTGGAYNNELQFYQGANLTIANGILSIAAKKQTVTGPVTPGSTTNKTFGFTSGRIESKKLYSASKTASSTATLSAAPRMRFSARIKLASGNGMWPAFWTYGDPWPTQGEIDIVEAKGQEPKTFYTNYFYGNTAGTNLVSGSSSTISSSTNLQTCWHVYEMVWSATKLEYYLDGILIETKTGIYIPSLFNKQEKITLNLAVGGNFFRSLVTSKIVPGTMQVDWVRVYSSN